MTMTPPLISVIIPVYNTEPYLRRCLDSVCGQTYGSLEIICVNDGSTDGSQAILDEYAARDARVKVLAQKNAGLAAARNSGLAAATGEWVTGVDSDDWLEPDTYSRLAPHLTADIDLLCYGCIIDGEIAASTKSAMESYCFIGQNGAVDLTSETIGKFNVYFWNKLFRREVLVLGGILFPSGRLYEDAPFLYCFASQARRAYLVSEKLYHYVQRTDSIMGQSARKTPRALDHLAVTRYTHDYYVRHGKAETWRAALVNLFNIAYSQTERYLPEDMLEDMRVQAWQLACDMGISDCLHCCSVQALRAWRQGRLARLFHGIYANRDSYGLGPLKLWTVVHTAQGDVHFCCGHRLFGRQR